MIVSVPLSVALTLGIWMLVRGRVLSLGWRVGLAVAAMSVVLVAARPVQNAILSGYPNDSFWDLGAGGRIGVLLISAVGLTTIFLFLAWKSRLFSGLPPVLGVVVDVMAGLLIYALIFSMSPQAYYTLYQMIFPDLPSQIVVRHVLSPRLFDVVQLKTNGTMSDHLAGVGLWAVLPFTLWCWRGQ